MDVSHSWSEWYTLSYLCWIYFLFICTFILQEILTALIYLTLTFFNLGLPVVWVLGLVFLSVRFSGFPYSSISAKNRLNSLVRLGRLGKHFMHIFHVYNCPSFTFVRKCFCLLLRMFVYFNLFVCPSVRLSPLGLPPGSVLLILLCETF